MTDEKKLTKEEVTVTATPKKTQGKLESNAKKTETPKLEINPKFAKMEKFLQDNKIEVYQVEKLTDVVKTTIFRSRMEVKGQFLPFAILIDNTIYTLLQVQIAPAVAHGEQEFLKIASYINLLNNKYRFFKFHVSGDGALLLNVSLTAKDNDFDPAMIHLVLREILKFLEEKYPTIMSNIWGENKQ